MKGTKPDIDPPPRQPAMPKKGGKKAKKGARKPDGPLGPAAAGEAFAAATAKALTDESGGEDGVDLEAVGGAGSPTRFHPLHHHRPRRVVCSTW